MEITNITYKKYIDCLNIILLLLTFYRKTCTDCSDKREADGLNIFCTHFI